MELTHWHTKSADEVQTLLGVCAEGLSDSEASDRLTRYGSNALIESGQRSRLAILLAQFANVMVIVLLVAAAVSAATGDLKDAAVIGVILVLNAVLGYVQEYRAEKAMTALKALTVPVVRVTRSNQLREVSSRDLVPGDVLHLEAGGQVGADARIVESANLQVDESALTGESVPAAKDARGTSSQDAPLGDRRSMLFMGTSVSYGRGRAVVVETGMRTEIGKIASMIQGGGERQTPLQIRLAFLGKWLAGGALIICALVFAAGLLRGEAPREMFLMAVSLAVAAIPESLPAIITVALALGAQRMVRRHALIRRLPAVETLGCVTVICSDKTGTLTQNRMTVTGLRADRSTVTVTGSGYEPLGQLLVDAQPVATMPDHIDLLVKGLALCNDAHLLGPADDGSEGWRVVGDPTEGALLVLAAKAGMSEDGLARQYPRIDELPFDSDRKRMTTLHQSGSGAIGFTKGAVDGIIERCQYVHRDGQASPMTAADSREVLALSEELAANGERVLGLAYRIWPSPPASVSFEETESQLTFLGLASMIDPPREEAAAAVATCRLAGIKPVLITGDHRLTAVAIARRVGIMTTGGQAVDGTELDEIDDSVLAERVEDISVYARVSPLHKLRVVEALQKRGHIVAMTGDGVNDAPALKRADIGVAMGISGTDVSKEASDMVLTNDDFATIVAAVGEGRAIYDNIRKFIRYMVTTNAAEVLTVAVAVLAGLPLPLLAIHILWINLVTDGLPALALGFEPPERSVMRRPPRPPKESLFARGMWQHFVWAGVLMSAGTLGVLGWGLSHASVEAARTMVFMTLAFFQLAHVLAIRSERESTFALGFLSNPLLTATVGFTFVLQLAILYLPILQPVFQTVPLSATQLAVCIVVASSIFFAVEAEKALLRRLDARRQSKSAATTQAMK